LWRTTTAMYHHENGLDLSCAIIIYSVFATNQVAVQYFLEGSVGGNGG
jgi:hypothetical protein